MNSAKLSILMPHMNEKTVLVYIVMENIHLLLMMPNWDSNNVKHLTDQVSSIYQVHNFAASAIHQWSFHHIIGDTTC